MSIALLGLTAARRYRCGGLNGVTDVHTVPVDIYDGSTLIDTVYVNQTANGGKWNSLGTYTFSGTARVVINSQGGCTTSADA